MPLLSEWGVTLTPPDCRIDWTKHLKNKYSKVSLRDMLTHENHSRKKTVLSFCLWHDGLAGLWVQLYRIKLQAFGGAWFCLSFKVEHCSIAHDTRSTILSKLGTWGADPIWQCVKAGWHSGQVTSASQGKHRETDTHLHLSEYQGHLLAWKSPVSLNCTYLEHGWKPKHSEKNLHTHRMKWSQETYLKKKLCEIVQRSTEKWLYSQHHNRYMSIEWLPGGYGYWWSSSYHILSDIH